MDNISVDELVRDARTPECNMTESGLTENVIKSFKEMLSHLMEETLVEVPYNNYGDRGYVDLFVRWNQPTEYGTLIEIKSVHALDHVTGANEICRQFQSMKSNFFDGSEYEKKDPIYNLAFAPDYRCINHIKDNFEMYKSASKNSCVSIVATEDNGAAFLPILRDGELAFPVSEYAEEVSKRCPDTKASIHLPIESLHDWLLQDYNK